MVGAQPANAAIEANGFQHFSRQVAHAFAVAIFFLQHHFVQRFVLTQAHPAYMQTASNV
jgi:hypothetical protein